MPPVNDSYFARRRRKGRKPSGGNMQVIGGKEHPAPLLEPGVDFLQERGIDQSAGERVIDTEITFWPGVLTRLNGRKYVGENTVKELARLIGWVDGDEARRIQAEFDAYRAAVEATVAKVVDAADAMTHATSSLANPTYTPVETPPPDQAAQIELARARHEADAAQIAAAEAATADAAQTAEEDDVATKHLTGAERAAVERQFGPLREVGDRGDLVDVPEDAEKSVAGVEEISGLETAKTTYVRGKGHAEQKADELAEADAETQSSPAGEDGQGDSTDESSDDSE